MKIPLYVLTFFFLTALSAHGASYSFQLLGGSAYNFRTPITIKQSGEEPLNFDARYKTRPFVDFPYYCLRIGRWDHDAAWELEFLHHKLYLENAPPQVQHFEISHGFNLITMNRSWLIHGFVWRVGLGAVVGYPDNVKVRNRTTTGDYSLPALPARQVSKGGSFSLRDCLYHWKPKRLHRMQE